MELRQRLIDDMKAAMKAKDAVRLSTLRMVRSSILNKDKEGRGELDETGILALIGSLIKQRRDAAEQYRSGGREELAAKEEQEIAILQEYLPKPFTEEELTALIADTLTELNARSIKDLGRVMKTLKERIAGRAEMSRVSAIAKGLLTQPPP